MKKEKKNLLLNLYKECVSNVAHNAVVDILFSVL